MDYVVAKANIPKTAISVFDGFRFGTEYYRIAKRSIRKGTKLNAKFKGRFVHAYHNGYLLMIPKNYF